MIKSIVTFAICLSFVAVTSEAQLSSIPKRFRQNIVVDEKHIASENGSKLRRTNEFGRRAYKVDRIERQLEAESESSMSLSMRRLEELSMSMSIDYSMSMADVEDPVDEDVKVAVPVENEEVEVGGSAEAEAVEKVEAEAAVSSAISTRVSMLAFLPVAWLIL
eukprot:CAMPEP_0171328362 /NCGR_PEP_ID=MMETSP0878-20121228/606_1 /TAXON_ID=67004 /ORGANISM="Thalassiosira weissflogii, Strain CCMP1336" /LENGTH=162 /DNA_ID=CAMNT_0011828209 /DNA_START=68 /DNA_END=556 /DNA_ORIENTATION=+